MKSAAKYEVKCREQQHWILLSIEEEEMMNASKYNAEAVFAKVTFQRFCSKIASTW